MTNDIAALVAELTALLEKSTPGPWKLRHRCVGLDDFGPRDPGAPDAIIGLGWDWDEDAPFPEEPMRGIFTKAADAGLVEFARNSLPTLLEALKSLQAERDEARDFYQIEFKRAQRFRKERDEADYHLGQLLGADPGPKYVAALQAAREWWNANDRAALEPAGGER